ncbi:MAG: ComEC/Rec2 family competence protein [Prevotella sp.]|nr:ComEC/Rec2 family competence protein [Prevotella sp.]
MTDTDSQVYSAIVMSEPVSKNKIIMFDIIPVNGQMKGRKVRVSLLKDTASNNYKNISVGDGISVKSSFTPIIEKDSTFAGYSQWLRNHGYAATTFVFYRNWLLSNADYSQLSMANRMKLNGLLFRHKIENRLQKAGLDDTSMSVVAAMTLGDKRYLDRSLYETFSQTGSAHILALSGMHLGIIFMLLYAMLRSRYFDWIREGILLFLIWSFVLVVGMPVSAIRAAIMMSIYIVADMFTEQKQPVNSLSLAAIILLVIQPTTLFDIGFQLSFTSVFSILLLFDSICNVINIPHKKVYKPLRIAWSMLVVSFVAQLGTFPLQLYHFGRTSVYFLLSNLIVIPAAYIIIIGTIAMLLTANIPILQTIFAHVVKHTIGTTVKSLSFFTTMPYGRLGEIHISATGVIILYVVIFAAVAWWFRFRKGRDKTKWAVN